MERANFVNDQVVETDDLNFVEEARIKLIKQILTAVVAGSTDVDQIRAGVIGASGSTFLQPIKTDSEHITVGAGYGLVPERNIIYVPDDPTLLNPARPSRTITWGSAQWPDAGSGEYFVHAKYAEISGSAMADREGTVSYRRFHGSYELTVDKTGSAGNDEMVIAYFTGDANGKATTAVNDFRQFVAFKSSDRFITIENPSVTGHNVLEDHIHGTGSAVPTQQNVHGLKVADLPDSPEYLVTSHRGKEHSNGIVPVANTRTSDWQALLVKNVGDDTVIFTIPASGSTLYINGSASSVAAPNLSASGLSGVAASTVYIQLASGNIPQWAFGNNRDADFADKRFFNVASAYYDGNGNLFTTQDASQLPAAEGSLSDAGGLQEAIPPDLRSFFTIGVENIRAELSTNELVVDPALSSANITTAGNLSTLAETLGRIRGQLVRIMGTPPWNVLMTDSMLSLTTLTRLFDSGHGHTPASKDGGAKLFVNRFGSKNWSDSPAPEKYGGGVINVMGTVSSNTIAILDSSINWIDRLVWLDVYLDKSDTAGQALPGGTLDNQISGRVFGSSSGWVSSASPGLQSLKMSRAMFYSRVGQGGYAAANSKAAIYVDDVDDITIGVWVENGTNKPEGYLVIGAVDWDITRQGIVDYILKITYSPILNLIADRASDNMFFSEL